MGGIIEVMSPWQPPADGSSLYFTVKTRHTDLAPTARYVS
jgi:hypothetical protein